MKIFVCFILALTIAVAAVQAGLLPHHQDLPHFVDNHHEHHALDTDVHHSNGIHLGHTSAIVIDSSGSNAIEQHHPVYHHDVEHANVAIDVHHHDHHDHVLDDTHIDVHHSPAAKIIHHEPIHQVEPVHHVTKVVHHEPHHFLHYTKPVVDHHVVHQDQHVDEHLHAADLHHADLHHHHHAADYHHHHHAAYVRHVVPHHHHHHGIVHSHSAKIVHKLYPSLHTPGELLAFAKHQLHGKYGKVKIIEKHY